MAFIERFVAVDAAGGGDGSAEDPWTLDEAAAQAAAGERVNIKAGVYALSAALSPAYDGWKNAPIVWRGYTDLPGDAAGPVVVLDASGAAQPAINCVRAFHRFENLEMLGDASMSCAGVALGGLRNVAWRCRVAAAGREAFLLSGQSAMAIGCEAVGWGQQYPSSGYRIPIDAYNATTIGCVARDGFGDGFEARSGYGNGFSHCVAARCTGHGFLASSLAQEVAGTIAHCTAVSCGECGAYSAGQSLLLHNCLLLGNGLYGVGAHATRKAQITLLASAFWGNVLDDVEDASVELFEATERIVLAADPLMDAANNDFRLKAGARALAGAGFPDGLLVEGAWRNWSGGADIGAVQQPVRPVVVPVF